MLQPTKKNEPVVTYNVPERLYLHPDVSRDKTKGMKRSCIIIIESAWRVINYCHKWSDFFVFGFFWGVQGIWAVGNLRNVSHSRNNRYCELHGEFNHIGTMTIADTQQRRERDLSHDTNKSGKNKRIIRINKWKKDLLFRRVESMIANRSVRNGWISLPGRRQWI